MMKKRQMELTFDGMLQQLAAAHQAELSKLRKELEVDCDRWRTKAEKLEKSMANSGSSGAMSQAVGATSVEVAVQTDEEETFFPTDITTPNFTHMIRMTLTKSSSVSELVDRPSAWKKFRHQIKRLVEWPAFDFTMGIIIFLNAVTIGLQSDFSIDEKSHKAELRILNICDYIFLFIYVLELAFRLIAHGREVLYDAWIKFDVFLVTLGIMSACMAVALAFTEGGAATNIREWVQNTTLLRILRLSRLVRAARMLGRWKTLWKLVKNMLNCLETMISTFVMIILTLFVFACFGVELVSRNQTLKEHALTKELVEEKFNSMRNIFLTLFQFVLVDGISDIYFPFIVVKPELVLYFGALVIFLSLMLANLVTAILVDEAISQSQMDGKMEEQIRKRQIEILIPKFREAFQLVDTDHSGSVTMEEFTKFDFKQVPELGEVSKHLGPEAISQLCDVLDNDDSGTITEEEMVDGLMQLALLDTSLELAQIKGLVTQAKFTLKKLMTNTEKTNAILESSDQYSPDNQINHEAV